MCAIDYTVVMVGIHTHMHVRVRIRYYILVCKSVYSNWTEHPTQFRGLPSYPVTATAVAVIIIIIRNF